MKLICKGQLEVKCSKCGKSIILNCDNMDFDLNEVDQRKMGAEKCHSSDFEDKCSCGQDITGRYEVWEYPEGGINHQGVSEISGGTVESEFDFTMEE